MNADLYKRGLSDFTGGGANSKNNQRLAGLIASGMATTKANSHQNQHELANALSNYSTINKPAENSGTAEIVSPNETANAQINDTVLLSSGQRDQINREKIQALYKKFQVNKLV